MLLLVVVGSVKFHTKNVVASHGTTCLNGGFGSSLFSLTTSASWMLVTQRMRLLNVSVMWMMKWTVHVGRVLSSLHSYDERINFLMNSCYH